MKRTSLVRLVVVLALAGAAREAAGYSVLAHEASIDAVWDGTLRPLLLNRYPHASADALNRARSFAYGGSVIQDLGYYPFGNKFFSNLVHYVRSGDFIETLIRDAGNLDEYAFALGALAHYTDDNTAHPGATNKAVPLVFPKLARKLGSPITYVQAPKQHVIVEFSFDVVQAAGGAYLPDAYKTFIGFRVATPLLERAFRETYGLEMRDLFADQDRAIATYRYTVSQLIPALTEAAWRDKHDEIAALTPGVGREDFVFPYTGRDYERDYGGNYQKPGLFARFVAVVYRIVPKIGPLKPLAFKAPTAEVEAMFAESFRESTRRYRAALRQVARNRLAFGNTDFDTGRPARHGEYGLADDTYVELLAAIEKRSFDGLPSALRKNILTFYGADPAPSAAGKRERKQWDLVQRALDELATGPEAPRVAQAAKR